MRRYWLIAIGIAFVLYFIFIHNLGVVPLLDSDETRYADMARSMLYSKDFITPHLDGIIFWDKPPLFFWVLCIFYKILGVSEFAVRLPSAICALITVIALFFTVKRTCSVKIAIASALILASCTVFVIFSRISILDMLLSANIALSIMCGFLTYYADDKFKKYYWLGFYIFSGLGILTKGIPAFVIPFGTMFFVGLWKKNLKEFFKPEFLIPGMLIFLIITLPWHFEMYRIHGGEFIKEYIIKHHFQRFIGSTEIGREHSLIYYIPTFIVGFLPWTISFFAGIKKLIFKNKNEFIMMNLIGFMFSFIFFSIARTKLITYILPLYMSSN